VTATTLEVPPRTPVRTHWDVLRWAVVLGWIAVAIALPLSSERTSSWHELQGLVGTGDVTAVRISPELPAAATGFQTVVLHWEVGSWNYVTTIYQERRDPDALDSDSPRHGHHSTATVETSPTAALKALQPGLVVEHSGSGLDHRARVIGFAIPWALSVVAGVLGLLSLITLVLGPQPWRATKWAWFWLFTFPPVQVLFVLLSGPTPGLPAPRDPSRRLTGGWAFLIAAVTGGVSIKIGLG
jgi:hypothetical protein